VNAELPLIAVCGSGAAMLAGIHLRERRAEDAMRANRVRLALTFPAGVDPVQAKAALSAIAGIDQGQECVFSVEATAGVIRHFLLVPAAVRRSVVASLTGVMPGLGVKEAPAPSGRATVAAKLYLPTPLVLSTEHPDSTARTLLSGLVGLSADEHAVLRFALRPGSGRASTPSRSPDLAARRTERLWQQKLASGVGFQTGGLVLVRAASVARAREICEHLTSCLRSRRGPVGTLRITTERGNRSLAAVPRTTRGSGWATASELMSLLPLPYGDTPIPGVAVAEVALLAPRTVARRGIRLFVGRDAAGERPIAISPAHAKQHILILGQSGSGKSTLAANAILSIIEQGFGVALIDPKADLFDAVLRRVQEKDAHRVAVVDPGDPHHRLPGLDLMHAGDSPDLRADVLSGAIRAAFPAEAWGVRTSYYLGLALRSLAVVPGATLADIGRLLADEAHLRSVVARLGDSYLRTAWQAYLSLSPSARAEQVQAPMNRVMGLLMRPPLRAVLAAPEPKLEIGALLAARGVLLVNLAPGVLGEAGAAVMGSLVMYALWSAIERRVKLPPDQRTPVFIVADELASLLHGTPFGFELLAERARGLGAGLIASAQTLGRIPEPTRGALLGNVTNFISMRASEDVAQIARQLPGTSEADIRGLRRFHVVARLSDQDGNVSVLTGRTEPLPPETNLAKAIRDASARRYASAPESDNPPDDVSVDDDRGVGRARRRS
jgi:hypothetical protein